MLSCMCHCDVSLSQLSSQMIEASIFDKPSINIAYGRYRDEMYDFGMAELKQSTCCASTERMRCTLHQILTSCCHASGRRFRILL